MKIDYFYSINFPICDFILGLMFKDVPEPKPPIRKFKPLSKEAYELGKRPYLGPRPKRNKA